MKIKEFWVLVESVLRVLGDSEASLSSHPDTVYSSHVVLESQCTVLRQHPTLGVLKVVPVLQACICSLMTGQRVHREWSREVCLVRTMEASTSRLYFYAPTILPLSCVCGLAVQVLPLGLPN